MAGKSTKVVLVNTAAGKTTQEFEINHAERILRMPNNGGWELPEDSAHTFDEQNGIGHNSNTTKSNGKEKS